jgi:hypothetical protein
MGIFDFFKKKNVNVEKKVCDYNCYIDIARIITHDDKNVMDKIEKLINDPIMYFNNYRSLYEERGIIDSFNIDIVIWLGLVDCLIENNYACERDYKDELDDFVFFMNEMNYDLKIDKSGLNPDGFIPNWCSEIDNKIQVDNLCIGGIDIDSDSFVMFICDCNKLDYLSQIAKSINHKITLASKL